MNKLLSLILEPLERGDDSYSYRPMHRKILLFISILFISLASLVVWVAKAKLSMALLPALVFGVVGGYGLVVGLAGSDKAVSNLWGTGNNARRR